MLGYLTAIFSCQLVGEAAVAALGVPVPGPVVGMVLLLVALMIHGAIPDDLGRTADALLSHLSLLFVPAGVGVMTHATLLGRDWPAVSAALLISTLLTVAVTAWLMQMLRRRTTR